MSKLKQILASKSKKFWAGMIACSFLVLFGILLGSIAGAGLFNNNIGNPALMIEGDWYDYANTSWDGAGTPSDPYLITSPEELAGLAKQSAEGDNFKGVCFLLKKDLDMSAHNWMGIGLWYGYYPGRNFVSASFQGVFDGGCHVISSLNAGGLGSSTYCGALFGSTYGAIIKNVGIESSSNKKSSGNMTYASAGQLVENASDTTIKNCYVYNCQTSGGTYAAGLCAIANGCRILNCFVARTQSTFGGYGYPAGIVGYVSGSETTITDCFVYANSYNTDNHYLVSSYATIENCYHDYHDTGLDTSRLTQTSPDSFSSSSFFTNASHWKNGGWDFDNIWTISQNGALPSFKQNYTYTPPTWIDFAEPFDTESHSGDSWDDAYEISTPEQLAYIAQQVNSGVTTYSGKYFKQTVNIKLGGHKWDGIGKENVFEGNYDGQNYEIEGIEGNYGLIGSLGSYNSSARPIVRNVIIGKGLIDNSAEGGLIAGGIAAYAARATITNCKNYASVTASQYAAGILATMQTNASSSINDCVNFGNITANGWDGCAAGICGEVYGDIRNCHNFGDVFAEDIVSGIAGKTWYLCEIYYCTSKCTISWGSSYAGGILGWANGSANCTMSNSSAYGHIQASSSNVGGLVGEIGQYAVVEMCSFYGTSNVNINLYGGTTRPTITACWMWCNDTIQVSSSITGDSANWTKYWAVVPGMNYGLPIQRELYSVADVASSTAAEIAAALPGYQVYS